MSQTFLTRMATLALGAIAVCAVSISAALAADDAHDSASVGKAVCVLMATEANSVEGVVHFSQTDEGVLIEAEVEGLTPDQKHGFHIHHYGDLRKADGTGTGGHFNPHGTDHGGPSDSERHVGDLGNLEADSDGKATYSRLDTSVSLDPTSENYVVGRGIIVHGGTDDLKSQPTGAAGPRIAQGVIGVANPE